MAIRDIINSQPNVQLVISAADLKELFTEWMQEYMAQKPNEKKEDVMVTADEAAIQLHVTKNALWRWGKSGLLQPTKVGKKVFYWQSAIDQLKGKKK